MLCRPSRYRNGRAGAICISDGRSIIAAGNHKPAARVRAWANRRQTMKTVLLAVAALSLSAACAYAGEAYNDPSEYRAAGVTIAASSAKIVMADTDPFGMRVPGVAHPTAGMNLMMRDTDPFEMRSPGVTFQAPAATLAMPGGTPARVAGGIGAAISDAN
ncbi:MAG TPA: hypothetical protein VJY39_12030 [Acidisphaera sp.]|nr:hypothetical protein [Acidisphaera sp.]